jgi:hypothetical protein
MGFSTAQEVLQGVLNVENSVPRNMSLWSNGGSKQSDNQSSITFGSSKSSSSLRGIFDMLYYNNR